MLHRAVLALLLTAALATPACSSPSRPIVGARALVVHAASRADDARVIAERFEKVGFTVAVEPEGPAVRETSTAIVYRVARHPSLPGKVETLVEPAGDVEVLPSVHPGPGTTDVVIWLVAR